MTREKSIETLKLLKPNMRFDKSGWLYTKQALEMAIQALEQNESAEEWYKLFVEKLEQEPCDDTVSIRKDVLKCRVGKLVVYNVEWLKKHWQMEMEIVCGVEPCEDAISREDAEQMFRNIRSHLKPQDYKSAEEFNTRDLMLLNAEQMIHALPSVSTTKNIVNHGTMNITL